MGPEALTPAPVETRIELRCDSGNYVGAFINNRWLELPCRQKRCRRDGVLTVHRWDLLTGQKSTVYRDVPVTENAADAAQTYAAGASAGKAN